MEHVLTVYLDTAASMYNPIPSSTHLLYIYIFSSCYAGYAGTNCEIDINECQSQPCQNNGVCITPYPNMYACQCRTNYVGSQCQILSDPCSLRYFFFNNKFFINF